MESYHDYIGPYGTILWLSTWPLLYTDDTEYVVLFQDENLVGAYCDNPNTFWLLRMRRWLSHKASRVTTKHSRATYPSVPNIVEPHTRQYQT